VPLVSPQPFVLWGVVIDTKVVPGPDRIHTQHYEITLAPDHEPGAVQTVLLTRRVDLYVVAAAAEGFPQRFKARWHYATRENGKRCQVLDDLEAVP
jgi:hypothetical protein